MLLKDRLNILGTFFFRWRSYTPAFYMPLIYLGTDFKQIAQNDSAWYPLLCLCIALSGTLFRVLIVGFSPRATSGRNVSAQRADLLNTTGAYSLLRNPLYLANFIIVLGIVMLSRSINLIIIHALFFMVFYTPIIYTEERYLLGKFKEMYETYSRNTPCIIPRFKHYQTPATPWSWRMVMRREQDSMLATLLCFSLVDYLILCMSQEAFIIAWRPIILALTGFTLWIPLKIVKKCTRLLKNR